MNISSHPLWSQSAPTSKKIISAYKKPFHLLRIYLAKQYAKLSPRSLFVGITGTVGKTTTTNVCRLVLSQ